MQKSNISWCTHTWNPVIGCPEPLASTGCGRCYARKLHDGRHGAYLKGKKLPMQYAKSFNEIQLFPNRLDDPLRCRAKDAKIFVCSMSDLFHEKVPFEFIDKIMGVIALCPQHQLQCPTKRSEIMQNYFKNALPRISALVYNSKYGQRTDIFKNGKVGRTRNRFTGEDMAPQEAPREGGKAGRGILQGFDNKLLSPSEGGVSSTPGVFTNSSDNKRGKNSNRGTSGCVGIQQQANSKGNDYQSREWNQKRQLPEELNADDIQSTETPCVRGVKSKSPQTTREQTPKNVLNRESSIGNTKTTQNRNDGQKHCSDVQNEAQSNISDMQPQNMETYIKWPLPNLWLGSSISTQADADRMIPIALEIPAAVHLVSIEPMLERVDILKYLWLRQKCVGKKGCGFTGASYEFDNPKKDGAYRCPQCGKSHTYLVTDSVDWVIIGCESGPKARLCTLDDIRYVLDQTRASKTPTFLKQVPINGKCSKNPKEWPIDLQGIQEYPK